MLNKSIVCSLLATTFLISSQTFILAAKNPKVQSKNINSHKKIMIKQEKSFVSEGEIKAVVNKKTGTMITVVSNSKDTKFREVVFNITKDTKFINGTLNDLKKGCVVKVTYGPVMTGSLPPQTTALSIDIIKPAKDEFQYEGTIKEVFEDICGKMIRVGKSNDNSIYNQIVFIITKETIFVNGTMDDLKKDCQVKVTYGPVMTKSIPPQTKAIKIEFIK